VTNLLEISDLEVDFHHDNSVTQAVRGVNIKVGNGETVAIVGESGSGKSVTALSTVSLLPDSASTRGSVRFRGQELIGARESQLLKLRGNEICFIFQEPMTSLNPLHTLEKQIGEIIQIHNPVPASQLRDRIIDLLKRTGIDNPAERLKSYPHQFSGGQRQRIMIAMALANKPSLLIADEPTTALDVTIQSQILDLLVGLRESEGMSLLFITHDLNIVRYLADRVYVMYEGRIVEEGQTERIFTSPRADYTRKLLAAEVTSVPKPADPDAKPVIYTSDMRVWYPIQRGLLRKTVGHVKAVNECNITVRQGQTLGVVGESGSGKTSLALAIARLISSEGSIGFLGSEINHLSNRLMRSRRKHIQVVFQDPYGSLSPRLTVERIVSEGLDVHERLDRDNRLSLARDALNQVGLPADIMDRYPHEFSGGQRQRIALARAIILRPNLVILDEPTSALDRTVQAQIIELLLKLQKDHDLAYIFISHDLRVVRALAHDVIVMYRGEIVEYDSSARIFEQPAAEYTRELMAASLGH